MLLSFSGDKHESKHSLNCSHQVFSFATIRGLRDILLSFKVFATEKKMG